MTRAQRSALAQFRSSVAPINIELGRYKGIPIEEGTCTQCNDLENEVHVLLNCPLDDKEHAELMVYLNDTVEDLESMSKNDILGLLLSHEFVVELSARTCKAILDRKLKV